MPEGAQTLYTYPDRTVFLYNGKVYENNNTGTSIIGDFISGGNGYFVFSRDGKQFIDDGNTVNPYTAPSTGGSSWTPYDFMGQTYHTPESLANAQRSYAEQQYNTNRDKLSRDYDAYLATTNRNEENLGYSYGTKKSALQNALEQGQFQSQAYYDRIAPSLYQSAEGISRQNIQKNYETQREELERQNTQGQQDIAKARSDIAYNQPLEFQALSDKRQQLLDQISNQMRKDQSYIDQYLAASAPQQTAFQGITAPTTTQLYSPTAQTAGVDAATGLKKTTVKDPQNIYDWIWGMKGAY